MLQMKLTFTWYQIVILVPSGIRDPLFVWINAHSYEAQHA